MPMPPQITIPHHTPSIPHTISPPCNPIFRRWISRQLPCRIPHQPPLPSTLFFFRGVANIMICRIVLHTPSSVLPHSPIPFLSSSSCSLSNKIYQCYAFSNSLGRLACAFRTLPCHNISPLCLLCRPCLNRPHTWFLVPPSIILFRS